MDPGEYAEAWSEFSRRMDSHKYAKFSECFHRLIQGTNVNKAESMVAVGIGELNFSVSDFTTSLTQLKLNLHTTVGLFFFFLKNRQRRI